MTARPLWNDPYWGALTSVLTALVEGVPDLLDDPVLSRQVREATAALTAETGPSPDSPVGSVPLTLTGALSLVETARALLDSAEHREWPGSGSVKEGLTGALSGLEDK